MVFFWELVAYWNTITLIGTYMHSNDWWRKTSNYVAGVFIIIGIIVTIIETHSYSGLFLYIGTIPVVLGIFALAMKNDQLRWPEWLTSFGRNCTSKIFVLHCSLRDLMYAIFGVPNNIIIWLMPLCFFALSGLIAVMLNSLTKRKTI